MTELEEARAWKKDCSERLAYERVSTRDKDRHRFFEKCVLAALSWVWDVQERAGKNRELIQIGDVITGIPGGPHRIIAMARGTT
jgi:hypothetical protein